MLYITRNEGFQIDFDNGYTISVQFGHGHYCSNRNSRKIGYQSSSTPQECKNAEIALWDRNRKDKGEGSSTWVNLTPGDQVVGWVPADLVGKIIGYVQKGQIAAVKRALKKL